MSFTFIGLFCKPEPRGGTAAGAMGLAGSLLPAPLASASQSRWDCSSDCTRCSVAPVPALHCFFPPGRIQLLLQTIIQTPLNGGEPGDLFYKGQTDVNSFSTKISAPLPSSQTL